MNQPTDVTAQDPLTVLWADVQAQRARIAKIADPSPKKALTELGDTGLSLVEDLVAYLVNFQNYVGASLGDIDSRLSSLEEDSAGAPPLLSQEEANMLLTLAATCEALTTVIRDSSVSINAEAKEKLDSTLALVAQVRSWIAENVDDEEDDDEPEDEDASDDSTAELS
ncbi:MAG: hypothetical protein EBT03_11155 [Betaproteobacteria bacterium]|nr:hypothetical protein [Betaproteobacteria bacterium]NCA17289.1 hypothetical protein [Betaproteobacteria bacterium]